MNPLIQQLEARRMALGMPVTILARRAGLPRSTVVRALSETGNPRFNVAAALADALGTTIVVEATATVEEMRTQQAADAASRTGDSPNDLICRGRTVIWREPNA